MRPLRSVHLERLIIDLDSKKFEVRTGAIAGLEKLGELAVPALDKARTGGATLEAYRRIDDLLSRLFSSPLTAEQIRLVRAREVLEQAATPEARQLLETLAQGASGALATQQAQAALERTAKSPPGS